MKRPPVLNALKETRTERGVTQEELALLCGLARQSIISIERGRFLPTIETALRLAAALNVPLEELFWLQEKKR